MQPHPVSFDRALEFLVTHLKGRLRNPPKSPIGNHASFGFEIWIPDIAYDFHRQFPELLHSKSDDRNVTHMWHTPIFLDAAWYLASQGILRASQYTYVGGNMGGGGLGFSVTVRGREWLQQDDTHFFIFTHPGAYGKYLKRYTELFGQGYEQRASQALQCFSVGAYLATCVMAGAATESIILAAAIKKVGDEKKVLEIYRRGSGTKDITKKITQGTDDRLIRDFQPLTDTIKHWRDPASHGEYVDTDEVDAMTALTTLVRFAQFMGKHWAEFTAENQTANAAQS